MMMSMTMMKFYFYSPHKTPGGVISGQCKTQIENGRLSIEKY